MDNPQKAIWIDLDNSPHVPLFAPIIRHYREAGVEVVLTARDHAQTVELLELRGFGGTFDVIGKHSGKSKLNKVRGLVSRARQLAAHIRGLRKNGTNISVAVSHGSRSMVLAAWWLRIPVLTMYDYEFTETRIFNRFSDRVLVPDAIPDDTLDKIGLPVSKRVKYRGLKEEIYIPGFAPHKLFGPALLEKYAPTAPEKPVLVVVRPPATTANYHADKSDRLFDAVVQKLASSSGVLTIIVPRTKEQGLAMRSSLAEAAPQTAIVVLDSALDGLDLIYASDVVISGGGTMNREAALLGVPVYSFFAGKMGALDAAMERDGRVTFIRSPADVEKIKLFRRERSTLGENACNPVDRFVINEIDRYL